MKRILILIFALLLTTPTFSSQALPNTETHHKSLDLVFIGANSGLNPIDLVKTTYVNEEIKPFVVNMEFSNDFPTLEETTGLEKVLAAIDQVILVIHTRYPKAMLQLNPVQEIAQEDYPADALEIFDSTAKKITTIIKNYHKINPNAAILATASGTGGEILLRTLKNNVNEIDTMILYYPTMAMVKNSTLADTLKDNGYNQEKVIVVAYNGDPTIPKLEKLKTNNTEVFTFRVIEETGK